jgi:toxin ParE1/3/4
MKPKEWTLEISSMALRDYQDILVWTRTQFSSQQARIYAQTIESALQDLRQGPDMAGVRWRPELGVGIASLHVARNGYKGRHMVIFRVASLKDTAVIKVLRVLHDSMDLQRHPLFVDTE